MKKKILISLFLLILIFNKIIISQIIIFSLEKWINKNITFDKINISYKNKMINFNKIKVFDNENYNLRNIFEAERINIFFDFSSFFSTLIIIDDIEIVNAKLNIYFELLNNNEIIDDSIGILKSRKDQIKPKIYPKKILDINFLVKNSKIKNSNILISRTNDEKIINIKLSDMNFKSFGNEKGYQHYKDVFKIILIDMSLKIPDLNFRDKVLKKYKIK